MTILQNLSPHHKSKAFAVNCHIFRGMIGEEKLSISHPISNFHFIHYACSYHNQYQVQSSDPDQSLPVVVFKSGMSSTSSQDLVLSETDLSQSVSVKLAKIQY